MADFLHATDLGSDTDDEDYVPEGAGAAEAVSEEENSGEDEADLDDGSKVAQKPYNLRMLCEL